MRTAGNDCNQDTAFITLSSTAPRTNLLGLYFAAGRCQPGAELLLLLRSDAQGGMRSRDRRSSHETSQQGYKPALEPQIQNIPVMIRIPSLSLTSHIFEISKRFRSLVVLLTHLIRRVSCNVQSSYSPFRAVQAMLQDHLLDVGNPNGPAGPAGHPHRTAVQLLGNRQPQPIPSSPPLSAAEAASQVKGGQGKVELSW